MTATEAEEERHEMFIEAVDQILGDIVDRIGDLDELVAAAGTDLGHLAELLNALGTIQDNLAAFNATIQTALVPLMHDTMVLSSGRILEYHRGSKRKAWDGRRLASLIAARVADLRSPNGEPVPPAVVTAQLAADLMACAGIDRGSHQWRATELKKRKIDPDQFSEWETGRPTVRLVRSGR